jgi:hypothetical protein
MLMIGCFPFAVYYFSTSSASVPKKKHQSPIAIRTNEKIMDVAVSEMNRGVEAKAKELRDIEVKILQNKGSILKLEEDKRAFVNNLELIQTQIAEVIKNARAGRSSSR